MSRRLFQFILLAAFVALFPHVSPAPLVYTPGEGWTYESVGGIGQWRRERAQDQLDVAQEAFTAKDYTLAYKSAAYL
ncbi:MAG: outer membrane protein assembly factor BamD, partial [Verrucomicrobiota bacterium]